MVIHRVHGGAGAAKLHASPVDTMLELLARWVRAKNEGGTPGHEKRVGKDR